MIDLAQSPHIHLLELQPTISSPADALSLYERNWRHIDQGGLGPAERALVQTLVDKLGGGRLLV